MTDERTRIKRVYQDRLAAGTQDRYSLSRPGERYMSQRREEEILAMLRRERVNPLAPLRILDVGCGRGERLADWARWGASPHHLHGIDLMEPFVKQARALLPNAHFCVGSADQLPYPDGSFEIVTQFTVFTSILDRTMKRAAAAELRRVVAPGGFVLWYDFRYPSLGNPYVSEVDEREIRSLFPNCTIAGTTVTLLPPLARLVAPISFGLCRALERMAPPLRSHYLAAIRIAMP